MDVASVRDLLALHRAVGMQLDEFHAHVLFAVFRKIVIAEILS